MKKVIKIFIKTNEESIELRPDKIRLTKSKTEQTGTIVLTFLMKRSSVNFFQTQSSFYALTILGNHPTLSFSTKALRSIWLRGKPLLVQAIFLLDNPKDVENLIYLMKDYGNHKSS